MNAAVSSANIREQFNTQSSFHRNNVYDNVQAWNPNFFIFVQQNVFYKIQEDFGGCRRLRLTEGSQQSPAYGALEEEMVRVGDSGHREALKGGILAD